MLIVVAEPGGHAPGVAGRAEAPGERIDDVRIGVAMNLDATAVVGRQHVAAITALWHDKSSQLWRTEVPRGARWARMSDHLPLVVELELTG